MSPTKMAMSTEAALIWAFDKCDGLEASGPTHLARLIAVSTGADEDELYHAIRKMIKDSQLFPTPKGNSCAYRRPQPGERRRQPSGRRR